VALVNPQNFSGEIICTGNEIVSGRVADCNARYAAARLHEAGLTVQCLTFLGDDAPQFQDTLARALGRSRFVIITGGLGPTTDDITAAAAAAVLQLPLHEDQTLLQRLQECFKARGLPWEDRFARLALIPQGASILDPEATACGFYLNHQETLLYFLPGVPQEMRSLFDRYVLPSLLQLAAGGDAVCQRTVRFFGLHETDLEQLLHRVCRLSENFCVGYYPNFPENHLTLTVRGPNSGKLEGALDEVIQDLAAQAGDAFLGSDSLEENVGNLLRARRLTLAVAESCSGGLICHRLTNVPGSSDYFLGGLVTYSNQAKIDLLNVPAATLQAHGAVSAPTAAAMASGAAAQFRADLAIAVTGIAGPSGGSPEKPVGTVYLGLASPQGVKTRHCLFHGSRAEIKILTAQTALDWLRLELP
jgi:competence/damage-inducible protein CinA-like protein